MLSSVLSLGTMVMAETANSWNGVTSESLMTIVDTAKEVVPIALPVVVAFVAVRKGLYFFLGLIKGA